MRCDACGSGDSLFVVVNENSQAETRLCRSCALEKGYLSADGGAARPQLDSILGQIDNTGDIEESCPDCGMGSEQLAGSGRLGCPGCIQVFRRQYILARKRRGLPAGYAGKVPRVFAGPALVQGPVPLTGPPECARLLADIESAVLAEDFEKAAFLRDRLGSVSGSSNGNGNGKSGNVV
jgi:protein-arginine kinase activator protein McsA